MSDIIATHALAKRYGQVWAVNQLNLSVPQGSIYGFLGPNGAGKTSTIRLLLGLARPTSGEVLLFGQPLSANPLAPLKRVGALVESPSFYPHLSGKENLELICTLRQTPRSQIQRVLKIVDLERDAQRLVKHYSLGMCQRLGLAIALLGEPELLILDEPANGLDPAGIREMRALLGSLPAQTGATVLVSSHQLGEVEHFATWLGILKAGRLVFEGSPEQLRASFQDEITLHVDHPQAAAACLMQQGWQAGACEDHALRVPVNGNADAAGINRTLVESGIQVYDLHHNQLSLEDIFLRMTETGQAN